MQHNVIFDKGDIHLSVGILARMIEEHYKRNTNNLDRLVVIVLMDGAYVFAADLLRVLDIATEPMFIGASSYKNETVSAGDVDIKVCSKQNLADLEGQHILVIDDIYDTGKTMHKVMEAINDKCKPASIIDCCLLRKRDVAETEPHFYALNVEKDQFVYGYGLDLFGKYRQLPAICEYKQ